MGSDKTRDKSYVNIFGAEATQTYAVKRSKGPRSKPALGTPLGQVKLAREPTRKGARRIGKATKKTPFDDIFGEDISTNSEQVISNRLIKNNRNLVAKNKFRRKMSQMTRKISELISEKSLSVFRYRHQTQKKTSNPFLGRS